MNTVEFIRQEKFIAIFRHIPKEAARKAARALYEGGVRIFEVTFNPSRCDTAEETAFILREIRQELGEGISVGAGTVLSVELAKAAKDAGAEFIVSPCTDAQVIRFAKENGMVSIPGAYTPTEIMTAYQLGADIVKIFPIGPNDEGYLKNVIGPLSHIPFITTGGVNPDTVEKFMALGAVAVAAGATVVTADLVKAGDYDTVRENARRHVEKLKSHC